MQPIPGHVTEYVARKFLSAVPRARTRARGSWAQSQVNKSKRRNPVQSPAGESNQPVKTLVGKTKKKIQTTRESF